MHTGTQEVPLRYEKKLLHSPSSGYSRSPEAGQADLWVEPLCLFLDSYGNYKLRPLVFWMVLGLCLYSLKAGGDRDFSCSVDVQSLME